MTLCFAQPQIHSNHMPEYRSAMPGNRQHTGCGRTSLLEWWWFTNLREGDDSLVAGTRSLNPGGGSSAMGSSV